MQAELSPELQTVDDAVVDPTSTSTPKVKVSLAIMSLLFGVSQCQAHDKKPGFERRARIVNELTAEYSKLD